MPEHVTQRQIPEDSDHVILPAGTIGPVSHSQAVARITGSYVTHYSPAAIKPAPPAAVLQRWAVSYQRCSTTAVVTSYLLTISATTGEFTGGR